MDFREESLELRSNFLRIHPITNGAIHTRKRRTDGVRNSFAIADIILTIVPKITLCVSNNCHRLHYYKKYPANLLRGYFFRNRRNLFVFLLEITWAHTEIQTSTVIDSNKTNFDDIAFLDLVRDLFDTHIIHL